MSPRTRRPLVRAGHVWFAVQGIFAFALLVSFFYSHSGFPTTLRLGGIVLALSGVALIVAAYRVLGKNHSPWTEPLEDASLVTTGPYLIVRHPVYLGYILVGFGGAIAFASLLGLAFAVVGFVYYDFRTRWEDKELARAYPKFEAYRQRVSGRLIPRIY